MVRRFSVAESNIMYDEETEELSDDLKTISGDIADLTKIDGKGGISLFTDNTKQTYKSTYQILKEISEIYDQLSDKQQAQLLEKLFGKTRAQTGAAILTNFEAADKAIKTMDNSAGSADKEMEVITSSLEYKLNNLRETWTGFWQDVVDRGDLGKIIDGLTSISELLTGFVSNIGAINTAAIALFATLTSNKMGNFNLLKLNYNPDTGTFGSFSLDSSLSTIPTPGMNYSANGDVVTQEQYNLLKKYNTLVQQIAHNQPIQSPYAVKDVQNQALNQLGGGADAIRDMVTQSQSLQVSLTKTFDKTKLLEFGINAIKTAMQGLANISGTIFNALIGVGISVITQKIVELVTTWKNKYYPSQKQVISSFTEINNKSKETSSTLENLTDEYQKLHAQINSGKLTTEEYTSVKESLLSVQNQLISSYGIEADAIDLVNGKYKEQIGLIKEAARDKASSYIAEQTPYISDINTIVAQSYRYLDNNWKTANVAKDSSMQALLKKYGASISTDGTIDLGTTDYEEQLKVIDKILADLTSNYDINRGAARYLSQALSSHRSEHWSTEQQATYRDAKESQYNIAYSQAIYNAYDELQAYQSAINEFNNAVATGVGVDESYKNLIATKEAFEAVSSSIQNVDLVYDKLNKDVSSKGIVDQLFDRTKVTQYYTKFLSGYTDDQIRNGDMPYIDSLMSEMGISNTTGNKSAFISKLIEQGYLRDTVKEQNIKAVQDQVASIFEKAFNNSSFLQNSDIDIQQIMSNIIGGLTKDQIKAIVDGTFDIKNFVTEYVKKLDQMYDVAQREINRNNGNQNPLFYNPKISYSNELEDEFNSRISNIDITQTKFGNVDLGDPARIIKWNKENIKEYRKALKSNDMLDVVPGDISTVAGASMDYWINDDPKKSVPIAFTPVFQKENGDTVLLDRNVVEDYVNAIMDKVSQDGGISLNEVLMVDQEGLDGFTYQGERIRGMIADVGDTAYETAEAMHYLGTYGAINLAKMQEKRQTIVQDQLQKQQDLTQSILNKNRKSVYSIVEDAFINNSEFTGENASNLPAIINGFIGKLDDNTISAILSGKIHVDRIIHDMLYKNPNAFKDIASDYIESQLNATDSMNNTANNIGTEFTNQLNKAIVRSNFASDIWTKYQDTINRMIKLNDIGLFDEEHTKDLYGYKELLEECNGEFDILSNKIKELSRSKTDSAIDATNHLSTIEGGLGSLDTIYQAKMNSNDHFVSASDLAGLSDVFGNLDYYYDFLSVMQDINATAEESQEAFNNLATAYIDTNYPLSDLTESNIQYTEEALKQMGVTNAHEAAQERLQKAEEMRTNALNELNKAVELAGTEDTHLFNLMESKGINSTQALASATFEEISALYQEAVAAGGSGEALKQLMMWKLKANDVQISTMDIETLINTAKASAVAASSVAMYERVKASNSYAQNFLPQIANGIRQALLDEMASLGDLGLGNWKYGGKKPSSSGGSGGSGGSSDDTPNEEIYDWIERKLEYLDEVISRLDKDATNTFGGWADRTDKLNKEIDETTDKLTNLGLANEHYFEYANQFLTGEGGAIWRSKIQYGLITGDLNHLNDEIQKVTDETLKEQINSYKEWYQKGLQAKDQMQDVQKTLSELAKTRFDNITSQFTELLDVLEGINSQLETARGNLEKRGRTSFDAFYMTERNIAQDKLDKKTAEREYLMASLNQALREGRVKEYSEEWYNMYKQIQDIDNEILTLNGDIIELDNNIRQTAWDNFDLARDKVSKFVEEIEFLGSMLENETTTDGLLNTGLNNYGNALMETKAVKFNTYMAQSEAYAREIAKIDRDLANDPYDQNLIKRREELLKLQQDSISSAESEKKAMIDLAREGYDAVLSKMQELIDKKKEALETEKDLYEYQKTLAEKNTELAKLYKQQAVYQNDTSEEGRKRLQQLKDSISKAEQDLKDTEYDRYIQDQQKLMDNMYEDMSEFIDEMFKDTKKLLQTLIDTVNNTSAENGKTMVELLQSKGYTISDAVVGMYLDAPNNVSNYNGKFDMLNTSVLNTITAIGNYVDELTKTSEKESQAIIDAILGRYDSEQSALGNNGSNGIIGSGLNGKLLEVGNIGTSSIESSVSLNPLAGYIRGLNLTDTEKSELMKAFEAAGLSADTDADLAIAAVMSNSLPNISGDEFAQWLINNYLPYLLNKGQIGSYATGVQHLGGELGWTNENGKGEIIRKSDGAILTPIGKGGTVFTNAMSDVLWNFAKNPAKFLDDMNVTAPTVTSAKITGNTQLNIGSINLPNVTKPEEFSEGLIVALKNDNTLVKAIQSVTVDRLMGRNNKKINMF